MLYDIKSYYFSIDSSKGSSFIWLIPLNNFTVKLFMGFRFDFVFELSRYIVIRGIINEKNAKDIAINKNEYLNCGDTSIIIGSVLTWIAGPYILV